MTAHSFSYRLIRAVCRATVLAATVTLWAWIGATIIEGITR